MFRVLEALAHPALLIALLSLFSACSSGGSASYGAARAPGAYPNTTYEYAGTNPFVDARRDNRSTFAVDVDDASYTIARYYLDEGNLPDEDAVRVEEFVNHFDYDYPRPRDDTFALIADGAPSPFTRDTHLVRFALQGREVDRRSAPPVNLTVVVDCSGSMADRGKLDLVRESLRIVASNLRPQDRMAIVCYADNAWTQMHATSGRHRHAIHDYIDRLRTRGSTNVQAGLEEGYRIAAGFADGAATDMILLCSDGVANVGHTEADDILRMTKDYYARGIGVSAVGFGMGTYNDVLMEKIANHGDGQYAYVDSLQQAREVFGRRLTGMLVPIANNVKVQVEFDDEHISSYRLLGYENRDVADRDFRADWIDGGEVGSGHSVTALYEVTLASGERREGAALATFTVRYFDPDGVPERGSEAREQRYVLRSDAIVASFDEADPGLRLAAASAQFAEILRRSPQAPRTNLREVSAILRRLPARLVRSEQVTDLEHLVDTAANLRRW